MVGNFVKRMKMEMNWFLQKILQSTMQSVDIKVKQEIFYKSKIFNEAFIGSFEIFWLFSTIFPDWSRDSGLKYIGNMTLLSTKLCYVVV